MKSDKKITDKLKRPLPPHDLEKRIRENWQHQLVKQSSLQKYTADLTRLRVAAAGLALVFAITLYFTSTSHTPDIVTAAISDIAKDKRQNIGVTVATEKWLSTHQVNMPSSVTPITMSKFCLVENNRTLHLQIAGEHQGEVHMFILLGEFDTAFWQKRSGTNSSMPWQLIQPFNDLSVLVLHTKDMNSGKVQQLIQAMFYA